VKTGPGPSTAGSPAQDRMNHRLSILFALALSAAALLSAGVLRGQMRQNANLTIFFTGDVGGEVAPCG